MTSPKDAVGRAIDALEALKDTGPIDAALQALREVENQRKLEAAEKAIAALYKGKRMKTRGEHGFIFMVDGSGSMTGGLLRATLSAVNTFNGAAAPAHAAATTFLWNHEKSLTGLGSQQLSSVDIVTAEQNLGGSDLSTGAAMMLDFAKKSQALGKAMHFVLVSDGDVNDPVKAYPMLEEMLKTCPSASIDFVIVKSRKWENRETVAGKMAEELSKAFPRQASVMTAAFDDGAGEIALAAAQAAVHRLKPLKKTNARKLK